jgi:hypothetical protein
MAKICRDYHCELYNDVIAVCSYSDLCFPDLELPPPLPETDVKLRTDGEWPQ